MIKMYVNRNYSNSLFTEKEIKEINKKYKQLKFREATEREVEQYLHYLEVVFCNVEGGLGLLCEGQREADREYELEEKQ